MTSANPFRTETYSKENVPLLAGWKSETKLHLTLHYPHKTEAEIDAMIEKIVATHYKEPELGRVYFPEPGKPIKERVPVMQHVQQTESLLTAPSGNSYLRPDVKESYIRVTLIENKAARSRFKKLMLKAKEEAIDSEAKRYNNLQSGAKFKNNSVPGMMQSKFNIANDTSGFNAITSVSRLFVRSAYGHCERMLTGGLYLPTYDDLLSYIYHMLEHMPSSIPAVMLKHGLKSISSEDLSKWFVDTLSKYGAGRAYADKIRYVCDQLTASQRTFVFCGGSLYHLFVLNDDLFRNWIDRVFDHDTAKIDPEVDPKALYKVESTLSVMVRSPNVSLLGKYTLDDAMTKEPDNVRKLISLCNQAQAGIDEFADIIESFIRMDVDIPASFFNKNLVRDNVLGCDTDSNLFTTEYLVQAYHKLEPGRIRFDQKAYEVNALAVYFMSRSIEHVFARMSTNLGCMKEDMDLISMKNEFLFVIFCRTNIAKHYAALITQQEGKRLPEAEIEAKGVNLIGSTRAGEIVTRLKDFMRKTFDDIIATHGQISAEEMLDHVADIEKELIQLFQSGDLSYLTMASIKPSGSYGDDTDKTSYFYYELWEEVFSEHYRTNVVLPNRMFKIPVIGEDKLFKDPKFIEWMKAEYPEIYVKLDDFITRKGRFPSYFLIPAGFDTIPEFFRKWLDIRRMVFDNLSPFYLFLSSFGISLAWQKHDLLISDYR